MNLETKTDIRDFVTLVAKALMSVNNVFKR